MALVHEADGVGPVTAVPGQRSWSSCCLRWRWPQCRKTPRSARPPGPGSSSSCSRCRRSDPTACSCRRHVGRVVRRAGRRRIAVAGRSASRPSRSPRRRCWCCWCCRSSSSSRWPRSAPEPVHDATGTLLVLFGVQIVVIQLLPASPAAGVHDAAPAGAVVQDRAGRRRPAVACGRPTRHAATGRDVGRVVVAAGRRCPAVAGRGRRGRARRYGDVRRVVVEQVVKVHEFAAEADRARAGCDRDIARVVVRAGRRRPAVARSSAPSSCSSRPGRWSCCCCRSWSAVQLLPELGRDRRAR